MGMPKCSCRRNSCSIPSDSTGSNQHATLRLWKQRLIRGAKHIEGTRGSVFLLLPFFHVSLQHWLVLRILQQKLYLNCQTKIENQCTDLCNWEIHWSLTSGIAEITIICHFRSSFLMLYGEQTMQTSFRWSDMYYKSQYETDCQQSLEITSHNPSKASEPH